MTARRGIRLISAWRSMLLVALLLACASVAMAQTAPASSSSAPSPDMPGMDHASMPGMNMDMPASSASTAKPEPANDDMQNMHGMPGMDHSSMPMTHPASKPAAAHDAMQHMQHGSKNPGKSVDMSGMRMGPMHGGSAPPDARSADYSDGVRYGPMRGMDMQDNAPQSMLLIDQLEAVNGRSANGQSWEAEGWYGNDSDKLWLRSEGERRRGRLDDGDIEALWNHAIASYWGSQLGLRHDVGVGPARDWAAFGVQGLSPYWFELEATGYIGDSGRTAARFRAEYDVLFTQRLILQPELEVNLYGQSDPARRLGSGLSDAQLGLRLRYEISRRFAPYIGVVWTNRYGRTADFVRDDHQAVFDRQWVAGIRFWF